MSEAAGLAADVERVLAWLYRDELRHSRLLGRLETDRKLDPPWPYDGVWFDPAGAALVSLAAHPQLAADPPWYQLDATDLAALELLAAVRLPTRCEVLCPNVCAPALRAIGDLVPTAELEVLACPPGSLGPAALPYEPVRLTSRHRALVVQADWRPDDFAAEIDENRAGVRWAILRDNQIISRLLVQPVSAGIVEVADVQTHPGWRRRGYGAALVQAVVRRLHEHSLTVTYSIHPTNEASRRLAVAVGFEPAFAWQRAVLTRP